jgi:hypothetical protein
MLSVCPPKAFQRRLEKLLSQYPLSKSRVLDVISSLMHNPSVGDRYPGLGLKEVRKLRMGLPEYNIGQSNGLRLIFLAIPEKAMVIPLLIYKKNQIKTENEVKKLVMHSIKEITGEIKIWEDAQKKLDIE